MLHTVAIIQARMASTRLPGKVLQIIAGKPMLYHVVERARKSKMVHEVVVATTTSPEDDAVVDFCAAYGYAVFRGSPQDVLDRYYQAALVHHAQVIVRLTADCPLLDPDVVDRTIKAFFESGVDFAANRLPPPFRRTYPIGLDTEVCSFAALERAWKEAAAPHEREHVMPYLYEVEGRFRVLVVNHEVDYGSLRWTVDTPEDLELVRRIFARFPNRMDFGWLEVLRLFEQEPELFAVNAEVRHKTYLDVDGRSGEERSKR